MNARVREVLEKVIADLRHHVALVKSACGVLAGFLNELIGYVRDQDPFGRPNAYEAAMPAMDGSPKEVCEHEHTWGMLQGSVLILKCADCGESKQFSDAQVQKVKQDGVVVRAIADTPVEFVMLRIKV